ncbi:MAG: iron ABC transporter permease [Syntrophobacterales bacterium]|nr:iron ABC transporter permease [Syntrophobacterales bacterium]
MTVEAEKFKTLISKGVYDVTVESERGSFSSALRWFFLLVVVAILFLLELCLGSVMVPVGDIVKSLLDPARADERWREIITVFRLPRTITAAFAGAGLGIAGLKMQTLFRNPLAGPYVLGISSGASLGVAILVLSAWNLGLPAVFSKTALLGNISIVVASIIGAGIAFSVVIAFSRKVQHSVTLLIIGLMIGYISNAFVEVLLQFAAEHQMQRFITWTFGSFGGVTWVQLKVFVPTVTMGLFLAVVMMKPLNALLLGEGYARSMGVNVQRTRILLISGSSLLAGGVTAFCGPVAFIGIAVPHLCRLIFRTSDHRILVPAVILMGAILAMTADLISQVPGSKIVLPLNAVTSIIGAPVVIWVILKRRQGLEV